MNNEIEQIAQQNDMSVEFVTWFFNEKKSVCGEQWFLMLGAMWEGWKGRSIEIDRLAAENVALKAAISAVNRTAEECELNGDELKYVVEPSEFEALTDLLDETPATDRIVAEAEARGVEKAINCIVQTITPNHETILKEFAQQLREGAK